jgi:glycosyltransferase involved in cell wall biosynthesis
VRIAWTGPVANGGGGPAMGLLILTELLRQNVEVDLYITESGSELPIEPTPGLRVIAYKSRWQTDRWYSRTELQKLFGGLASRSLGTALLSIRLLIEHRRNRYDAIYQISQPELLLLGRLRRFGPPIVVHPGTHAAGELRWHRAEQTYALRSERRSFHMLMRGWLALRAELQARDFARADLVVGLSDRFNELVHKDYGVPRVKLQVVRTPVDLERFNPDVSGSDGPVRNGEIHKLLFISRISTRKGVEEIVALSHRLADRSGSVRLLVIGESTQWSDYRHNLADLHPGVAEYVGGMASANLPELMRSSAMLLVPSRYEPGSLVTAEALGCGLPVVLSDEVGNAEVVDGPHARIHRAGDVDSLEAAVRSMLAAVEDNRDALRVAARENAEREFAVSTVVGTLIDVIASVTSKTDQPRSAPAVRPAPSETIRAPVG